MNETIRSGADIALNHASAARDWSAVQVSVWFTVLQFVAFVICAAFFMRFLLKALPVLSELKNMVALANRHWELVLACPKPACPVRKDLMGEAKDTAPTPFQPQETTMHHLGNAMRKALENGDQATAEAIRRFAEHEITPKDDLRRGNPKPKNET